MKILITGASGTVGYSTMKHLLAQDKHDITVFDLKTRKTKNQYKPFKNKISIVYGDIVDKSSLAPACHDQELIIHLDAIITPLADDDPEPAQSVNVDGTNNLIQAVKEFSPAAFMVYGSSISVYGDRLLDPNINVSDPLLPSIGDEYAATKIAAEELVKSSGLAHTIFRITAVMGVNNHKISKLMFHMPLATPIELVTPLDAGKAFANAVDRRDALKNRIFNLSGGKKCQVIYRDFLSQSFENFGMEDASFPENSFAAHNFHCGYYADGDDLEKILKFRSETVNDLYEQQANSVNPIIKSITYALRHLIKRSLLLKSEPLAAIKEHDTELITRFFG